MPHTLTFIAGLFRKII